MEEVDLTLRQNLCAARLFLSMFDLNLDENAIIVDANKVGILKDNTLVGSLWIVEEKMKHNKSKKVIKIECQTNLGKLTASYDMSDVLAIRDIECGGNFAYWNHEINYNIDGINCFSGGTRIEVSIDTFYKNTFRMHTEMKYIDSDAKKVTLNIQNGGLNFGYEASIDDFYERIKAEPYNKNSGWDPVLMYHGLRKGELDAKTDYFCNEKTCFIGHDGPSDNTNIRIGYGVIEGYKKKHFMPVGLILKNGENESSELAIQSGMLMHELDPSCSQKISDVISCFNADDVSFLRNLIDASFWMYSDEERRAILGFDIERIKDPIDIYFGTDSDDPYLTGSRYRRLFNKN